MSLIRRHFQSFLASTPTMTFRPGTADRSLPAHGWLIGCA
jgi:hypothetical protein